MRHSLPRLVYQPLPADAVDRSFDEALEEVVASSEAVDIACPYLSADILRPLVGGRRLRLVTDLDACMVRADTDLKQFLVENEASVRDMSKLHAKVVLGEGAGLFGSANFTTSGLTGNFEVAALIEGSTLDALRRWFHALWEHAKPLDRARLEGLAARPRADHDASRERAGARRRTGALGWLGTGGHGPAETDAGQTRETGSGPDVSPEDLDTLARRLRELTPDLGAARVVLETLARGLTLSGLAVEDPRLHLNFTIRHRINVTVGQRDIVWCYRGTRSRRPVLGMMLCSEEIAEAVAAQIPSASVWWYTRNKEDDVPCVSIPTEFAVALRLTPKVEASWKKAIGDERERSSQSSYLGSKRPALYAMLTDPSHRDEVLRRAFPP